MDEYPRQTLSGRPLRSRAELREVVSARQQLVRQFPCQDCGARAGEECFPEYGCIDADRRPDDRDDGFNRDFGGAFDGHTVTSDADPGL